MIDISVLGMIFKGLSQVERPACCGETVWSCLRSLSGERVIFKSGLKKRENRTFNVQPSIFTLREIQTSYTDMPYNTQLY